MSAPSRTSPRVLRPGDRVVSAPDAPKWIRNAWPKDGRPVHVHWVQTGGDGQAVTVEDVHGWMRGTHVESEK